MVESSLSLIFGYIWQIIQAWWWLFLPFLLGKPLLYLWLWWRFELFINQQKFILLEVKLPEESIKPIRAMEQVMDGIQQGFWDPPNFWEKWWNGKISIGFQLEMSTCS